MKKIILVSLLALFFSTGCEKKIERIEVDCSSLSQLLTEIDKSDQEIRMETDVTKIDFDLMRKLDSKNFGKVVSIIEQCGMPSSNEVDKKHIQTIFFVIQHSNIKYQKEYFPLLEERAKDGDLKKSSIAMLKDRILVYEGKPQIYGTQLNIDVTTNVSTLCQLEHPESVDRRRRQVGLEPLHEYLKEYDIEFTVEQVE